MNSSSIRERETWDGDFHIVYNRDFIESCGLDAQSLWAHAEAGASEPPGRGEVKFFVAGGREMAFKHYCRGGMVGRFIRDRYFFRGGSATRARVEWRALCALHEAGLPVPTPLSARHRLCGAMYTADLITSSLRPATPLSAPPASGVPREVWRKVGETLRRFDAVGVAHADLNAHNILWNATSGVVSVVDFDRAQIKARGDASGKALARLKRSLEKLRAQKRLDFTPDDWRALETGYAASPPDNASR